MSSEDFTYTIPTAKAEQHYDIEVLREVEKGGCGLRRIGGS